MAVIDDRKAQFLAHAEHVRSELLQLNLSEADTRSYLIEPVLASLGYDHFANLRREVRIPETNESIDFELRVGDRPKALVEAKRIQTRITVKHAAQCVQYASLHGVRWCVITNGLVWALYDAHLTDVPLKDKRVAEVRIDGDADSTEEAWDVLLMLALDEAVASRALQTLLIERVVSDQLSSPDSPAIVALRRDIRRRFGETVSGDAIVEFIDSYRSGAGVSTSETTAEPASPQVPESVSPAAAPTAGDRVSVEPDRPPPSRRGKGAGRVTIRDLVDAGLLPPDAVIEALVQKVPHSARVRNGMIEWEGRQFATPSAASMAIHHAESWNGWVDWRYKGELLTDLRDRFRRQAPPDVDPPPA